LQDTLSLNLMVINGSCLSGDLCYTLFPSATDSGVHNFCFAPIFLAVLPSQAG